MLIFQESGAWFILQNLTTCETHVVAPVVYPLAPSIMTPHVRAALTYHVSWVNVCISFNLWKIIRLRVISLIRQAQAIIWSCPGLYSCRITVSSVLLYPRTVPPVGYCARLVPNFDKTCLLINRLPMKPGGLKVYHFMLENVFDATDSTMCIYPS